MTLTKDTKCKLWSPKYTACYDKDNEVGCYHGKDEYCECECHLTVGVKYK